MPGSAPISNRLIDFVALKWDFEVISLDAADAFYRAPETGDVAVGPPLEYLERLRAEGKSPGDPPGPLWAVLKPLGPSWGSLGLSWGRLRRPEGFLGPFWGSREAVLGPSGRHHGPA